MPSHARLQEKVPASATHAARAPAAAAPARVSALPPGAAGGVGEVRALQRQVGNQAVMRMLDARRPGAAAPGAAALRSVTADPRPVQRTTWSEQEPRLGRAPSETQRLEEEMENDPVQTLSVDFSSESRPHDTTDEGSTLSNSSSHPVQRILHTVPQFIIHTPAALSGPAAARLQSVVDTLVTTLDNDAGMDIGQLIISVEQEGGPKFSGGNSTIAGDNPAETITIPQVPYPDIQITIQRPFAEAATEGEMLGLLAHEVGVHNIPSDFKGVNDMGVTAFAPIHTPRKAQKNNTASGGYEFANWVGGGGWHGNRQHDHVMVADILRNPPPVMGPMPVTRANVYLETVLGIGDTIWADLTKPIGERQKQTAELAHLYLVDIARIIASDDGRMPPAKHGLAIDDIYGELFNQVLLPQRGAHPWIPAERPKSNALSLAWSLATFITKVKLEKALNG